MIVERPPRESDKDYIHGLEQKNLELRTINREERAMLEAELTAIKAAVGEVAAEMKKGYRVKLDGGLMWQAPEDWRYSRLATRLEGLIKEQ